MLNTKLIDDRLQALGWSQAQLAEACDVSRESVSNWMSGESLPRPRRLKVICEVLDVPVDALLLASELVPEPIVAYRTRRNQGASAEATETASDVARHLRELVPYIHRDGLFAPATLINPIVDDSYISKAAAQTRARLCIPPLAPLSHSMLIQMHRNFGSILVPVLWGEEKVGHENALSVYLPESKSSWVIFNLNARADDFNYWMAHELAHCYTWNSLQGEVGETFAERFAQALLFPEAAAELALNDIVASDDPMARAKFHAEARDISIVTVIRQIDRVAALRGREISGLETDAFWTEWTRARRLHPTVAHALFGIKELNAASYISESERVFDTPVFNAITAWQAHHGGSSAAFVATALNVALGDADQIAKCLAANPGAH